MRKAPRIVRLKKLKYNIYAEQSEAGDLFEI